MLHLVAASAAFAFAPTSSHGIVPSATPAVARTSAVRLCDNDDDELNFDMNLLKCAPLRNP